MPMPMPGPGGGGLFTMVPLLVMLVFVVVIGLFIFHAVRGLSEWSSNNQQPVTSEPVTVKDKRTHVQGRGGMHRHNHMHGGHTSTTYYITFEFEDGERREFRVNGKVYGQIAPGDNGTLTYQGTRYHNFERQL